MKALVNPCAASGTPTGTQGRKSARQTLAQPQQRFADVAVLIDKKQQKKPDKEAVDKPAKRVEVASRQRTVDIHKRDLRSKPESNPATDARILSDQPAPLSAPTAGDGVTANSVPVPILMPVSADLPGTDLRPAKVVDGVIKGVSGGQATVFKEPSRTNPRPAKAVEGVVNAVADDRSIDSKETSEANLQSPEAVDGTASAGAGARSLVPKELLGTNPPPGKTADGALDIVAGGQQCVRGAARNGMVSESCIVPASGNVQVHVARSASVRHPVGYERTEAQASKPVLTNVSHPNSPVSQKREQQGPTAAPQVQPMPTSEEKSEPTAVAGSTVEKAASPQAEKHLVVANPVPNTPSAVRPVQKNDSPAPVRKPEPVTSTAASVPQDRPADLPQEPQPSLSQPRLEGQPHVASRRQDSPTHEQRHEEIAGSEGEKTLSVEHRDTVNAPEQSPVAALDRPFVAVARAAFETRPNQVMEAQPLPNPVRTVGQQILDSVRASASQGDREISVRLQPPELGTITVRLREEGGHLEGVVEVGRRETRREIERALPEVVRGLQDMGVQIRKFEVTGSDSSGPDLGRGQPQQDTWSGQNGSGQSRDQLPTPHTPWQQETVSYAAHSEETARAGRPVDPSSDRIDLLL
jgi:flagellar hook-length control protein FliK